MKRFGWWICAAALVGCAAQEKGRAPSESQQDERAAGGDREACMDAWLRARGLNEFGDPPGTMYAGGTPLFDEATGERRDRIAWLAAKHPELAAACP